MLHIIGVAHRAQSRKPDAEKTAAQKAFEGCLQRTITEVHPAFVAEEDNEEFLRDRGEVSISKDVVGDRIEHRFCEPDKKQRSAIGSKNFSEIALELAMTERLPNDELGIKARAIEIARYFPIRERFWLDRLSGCDEADGILCCGDVHVESFLSLLAEKRIAYSVVQRGIGRNEKDQPYYEALKYLREHPELRKQ